MGKPKIGDTRHVSFETVILGYKGYEIRLFIADTDGVTEYKAEFTGQIVDGNAEVVITDA